MCQEKCLVLSRCSISICLEIINAIYIYTVFSYLLIFSHAVLVPNHFSPCSLVVPYRYRLNVCVPLPDSYVEDLIPVWQYLEKGPLRK